MWTSKAVEYSVSQSRPKGLAWLLRNSPETAPASRFTSSSVSWRFWNRSASSATRRGRESAARVVWYTVSSNQVHALSSAAICSSAASRSDLSVVSVPSNIRCSKKWAKPVRPSSTSSREPTFIQV